MDKNEHVIKSYLYRISNILLINGGFLNNLGLYTGEMGIVLFFYRYARFTQNEAYSDYSCDLLNKIQHKISSNTPVNYRRGLAGIGAVIEYLVQNGFLEADTDELLEDFDKRIFFTYNLSHLPDDKIADIGYYALWRMSGNSAKKDMIRQTLLPFIPTRIQLYHKNKPDGLTGKAYSDLLEHVSNTDLFSHNNMDLGFQNGLAGWGLSLLTELDGDDSWISLFLNDFVPSKNESLPV